MALYRHLRSKHPDERPYTCHDCMHTFNNLRELSSHCSNHHWVRSVLCKYCQYHSTTKVKMWQHVCSHTTGVKCATCGKGFATITEMLRHQPLHNEREEFTCQDCDSMYHTRAALNIHHVGKYSPGYPCANCNAIFDMPMQRNRHQKHCIWRGWYLPLVDFFLHFLMQALFLVWWSVLLLRVLKCIENCFIVFYTLLPGVFMAWMYVMFVSFCCMCCIPLSELVGWHSVIFVILYRCSMYCLC